MKYEIKYSYTRYGIILAVAVYDTDENQRTEYSEKTLYGLLKTVNFNRHTLFISDNGSCEATQKLYGKFRTDFLKQFPEKNLIFCWNGKNLGTAKAINKAIQIRQRGQKVCKLDNDVIIHEVNWIERLEDAMERDKGIGILALKRKDLDQTPWHSNPDYRTEPKVLPHNKNQQWAMIEETSEIMGTCTMFSAELLDRIGGLIQCPSSPYGWDDPLISLRSRLSGFRNAYLPYIHIDHIDNGKNQFTKWKQDHATETMKQFQEMKEDFESGVRDVFVDPFDD